LIWPYSFFIVEFRLCTSKNSLSQSILTCPHLLSHSFTSIESNYLKETQIIWCTFLRLFILFWPEQIAILNCSCIFRKFKFVEIMQVIVLDVHAVRFQLWMPNIWKKWLFMFQVVCICLNFLRPCPDFLRTLIQQWYGV